MKRSQIRLLRTLSEEDEPIHTGISADAKIVKDLNLFESDLDSMLKLGYLNRDRMDNKEREFKYSINMKGLEKVDMVNNSNSIKLLSIIMAIATIAILILTFFMALALYAKETNPKFAYYFIGLPSSVVIGILITYLIMHRRYLKLIK